MAGISSVAMKLAFAVSRFMETSIAMIDRHYGHLADDGREQAVSLLDSLAAEKAVDAGWTLDAVLAKPLRSAPSRPRRVALIRSQQSADSLCLHLVTEHGEGHGGTDDVLPRQASVRVGGSVRQGPLPG